MKLIVGLGNPGSEYAETKHNMGFWAVDAAAERWGAPWGPVPEMALVAQTVRAEQQVLLCKPQTFMNDSGEAVASLRRRYPGLQPADVLVVYDDMDFLLGQFRVRLGGSPGHHNGMRSVVTALQTEEFPRIRIGIGRPTMERVLDYVLSPFAPEQAAQLRALMPTIAQACDCFVKSGIAAAMNRYNPSQP